LDIFHFFNFVADAAFIFILAFEVHSLFNQRIRGMKLKVSGYII
jgi:hypothetical protein